MTSSLACGGHFFLRRIRAELLAGVELDDLAAGFLGLGDGFEGAEFLEGVGLAADGEPFS